MRMHTSMHACCATTLAGGPHMHACMHEAAHSHAGTDRPPPLTFPPLRCLLPLRSGPREDATRIGSAGVVRRQAVDISPLRRVNQVRDCGCRLQARSAVWSRLRQRLRAVRF